jgi:CRISPR system Cascade subunit CasE
MNTFYLSDISYVFSPHTVRLFATPYEQHRTLWRLFPNSRDRCFLFRELQAKQPGISRRFAVLSQQIPDLSAATAIGLQCQTKLFAPSLSIGQALRFETRLSVSISKALPAVNGVRPRGIKVDPVGAAISAAPVNEHARVRSEWISGSQKQPALLLSEWLKPRLSQHGLCLDLQGSRVMTYEPNITLGNKVSRDGRDPKSQAHALYASLADVQGIVTIEDPKAAWNGISTGIGRGKALGCGLFLIKPLKTPFPWASSDDAVHDYEELA